MNSKMSIQPNFTSTFVPKTAKTTLKTAAETLNHYFTVKGFGGNMSIQRIRDRIALDQAGIRLEKDGFTVIGKDREADEFIARTLRKDDLFINYTQDTPETKFEGPIFDLTI